MGKPKASTYLIKEVHKLEGMNSWYCSHGEEQGSHCWCPLGPHHHMLLSHGVMDAVIVTSFVEVEYQEDMATCIQRGRKKETIAEFDRVEDGARGRKKWVKIMER